MIKRQSGFALFGGLLILLALVVLVGTGYFVWHKNQAAPSTKEATTKSADTRAYSGSPVNLKLLGSSSMLSFDVPDGWVADKGSSDSLGFFADELTYKPGTKFSYSNSEDSRDIDRFMLSITDATDIPKEYKTYTKSDYGTVNGNQTTLYYHEFSKGEHIGNVQMEGGEKEHMYFITKGNNAVMVSYYILAGDKDQKQLIDQVIHTIKY